MNGKATLKLRKPKEDNIQNLYHENYDVMHCEYSLDKTTDKTGQVNSGVMGGSITVALPILPNDNIMSWVFDAGKLYNGEVTINDGVSESLEKIYFEEARPVGFRFHYEPGDATNVVILLTINAQRMVVGEAEYQNRYR
jgi:hypothetical protein